jgi:hypothetical protein
MVQGVRRVLTRRAAIMGRKKGRPLEKARRTGKAAIASLAFSSMRAGLCFFPTAFLPCQI